MAGALTAMIAAAFSGVTADEYFEYTTLLLPGNGTNGAQNNTFLDGSTNNFTITRNGNTTQGTFSPFSQTGWGNYFDGTGDYLTVPSNAAFSFGTGDYSMEFWMYCTSYGSGSQNILDCRGSAGSSNNPVIYLENGGGSGTKQLRFSDTVNTEIATASNFAINTWTHVVATRSGTTTRMFTNGTLVGTSTSSVNNSNTGGVFIGAYAGGVATYFGYLSNVRIVKGSIPTLYQTSSTTAGASIFTPPTSPLTAISGTSLLTCQSNRFIDNSTNTFTITVNGNTSVVAFSPFNPTASWSAATYGGSGYFDGSTDYLNIASNSAFDLTGDYTVECWFYANSFPSQPALFGIGSDTAGLVITISSSKVYAYIFNVGNTFGSGGTTLTTNSWNHIAVVRSGTTNTCYINGSQSGTTYSSSSTVSSTGGVGIGRTVAGTSFNDWNGYISNFRIVKGTAVYTAAFTPPTAPLTAITNTSLLLNFTNAGIYDATSKNDLETVADAQISNTTAKWGSTSIKFDGTGDYLKGNQATNDLYTFSGDFTIETWVYSTSSAIVGGGYPTIFATSAFNGTGIGLKIQSAGGSGTTGCACVWYNNTQILTGTSNIADSAWHHVAVTRSGSTIRLFVDGTQQTSATNSSTFTCASGYPLTAADSSSAGNLTGYIQDLRITKGYARYTANFTAPTAAFPTL